MASVELTVPDLGGFAEVPVIEVLVKPGDVVAKDAPLVTLESEKATMEIPASAGGIVGDVRVKIGDKVSSGSVLATVTTDAPQAPTTDGTALAAATGTTAPPSPRDSTESSELAAPASDAAGETTTTLVVPDLGGFADVPVIEVLVKAGDTVAKDAPLVTLESEKATMEIPASAGGVVRDVKVRVGDKVSTGSPLAIVGGVAAPQRVTASPSAPEAAPPAAPAAPAPAPPAAANGKSHGATDAPAGPSVPVHASPAIRRFARELGVDLGGVRGSGPNGRITRDDVQCYVKRALAGAPAASAAGGVSSGLLAGLPPWPKVDFEKFGPVERVALTRIQRLSGPNLARNWVAIPHVTQNDDADVTEIEAFRKQINAEQKDAKVTMLAFLMKASVAALKRFPNFNSSLDGDELVRKHYYHLGFAADTPNGLLVPVIRDVDRKGIVEIARETAELAAKARDGKLGPADMTGATFTISSLGSIGGTYFTPIINAPEVAILGATRAAIKPVWNGTAFEPRLIQPLSLSYDHRVIDGASAARFTTFLAGVLADLRRTLL